MSTKNPQSNNQNALRLAMATATFGLCMGIAPATSLAMTSQPVHSPDGTDLQLVAPSQGFRLAGGYMKLGDIKGEGVAQDAPAQERDAASVAPAGDAPAAPRNVDPAAPDRPVAGFVKVEPWPAAPSKPRAGYLKIGDIKGE